MSNFLSSVFKFASSIVSRYNTLLLTKPLRTKMITSGTIAILADTICQKVIEKKLPEHHSVTRTLRQSTVSCFYGAPMGHFWFGAILPTLISPLKARPLRIITSVILDNTLLSAFSISTGVFLLEFLKSGDVKMSVDNVKSKFFTIISNSVKFWCIVSTINHTFVPVHYKVLVGNICGIFWQVYMSYIVNKEPSCEEDEILSIIEDDPEEIPANLKKALEVS